MTSDPVARYLAQRAARHDRRTRLRPMGSGEILDVSLRIYRNLGWQMLSVTALPTVFCTAAVAFIGAQVLPGFFTTSNVESVVTQMGESALAVFLGLFVAGPLFLIGLSFTAAVAVSMTSDGMVGNVPNQESAVRAARSQLARVALLWFRTLLTGSSGFLLAIAILMLSAWLDQVMARDNVTAGLLALFGILAFMAGGLVLLVVASFHALAVPAMISERVGVKDAIRRSKQLMSGAHGTLWNLYLVLFIAFVTLAFGVQGSLALTGFQSYVDEALRNLPYGGLLSQGLSLLPEFLVLWTLIPIWCVAVTVLYYERRVRLEGYDIEQLASEVWRADRASRFQL